MSGPAKRLPEVFADELRAQIRDGVWAPGDRLPKEAELVEEYGVSRISVRSGLQMLAATGWIETRHGIGTFVSARPPNIRTGLEELRSLSDTVREQGREPEWMYHTCERSQATELQAARLDIDHGTDVSYYERTLLADGIPLAFDYSVVPWHLFPDGFEPCHMTDEASAFAYFERHGMLPAYADCTLTPVHSETIGWDPYRPESHLYLLLDQKQILPGEVPLSWSLIYFVEDRFSFEIVRRRL